MRNLSKIAFIFLFLAAHIFILRNAFLLSKDMLLGDSSAEKLFPSTRYGIRRLPDTPLTRQYNAQNRLAVDFAQIYFPAQQMASLGDNYRTGALDPLQRPSRYAPPLHFLCSLTLCRLDYGPASLLDMLVQLLLFYPAFIISFKLLDIQKDLPLGILLVNIHLFLTPAGLSWFERGQFSLYVAAGYLLLLLGFVKKNTWLILLSALFAFVKWTSFPYVFVVLSVVFLTSNTIREGKRNLLVALAYLLVVAALLLPFAGQSLYFLQGLLAQERDALPGGVSLAKLLPVTAAKLLPLPLIVLGWLHARMNKNDLERAMPFWAGAAVLMLTYPTLAYEYNLPSLLGFIPLLFYWARNPADLIPAPARGFMKYAFLVFLLISSFSNYMYTYFSLGGAGVLAEYFLISAVFLLLPLFYTWRSARK